eukprot:658083-Hanusia_phi.AAC.2
MVGGAFLLQLQHYKTLNGYSNKYFGWGQEDDDMYERVRCDILPSSPFSLPPAACPQSTCTSLLLFLVLKKSSGWCTRK